MKGALSAHDGIVAEDMKEMAVRPWSRRSGPRHTHQGRRGCGQGGRPERCRRQVHRPGRPRRLIAVPDQLCKRTGLGGKEKGCGFLAALTRPWTALLAPERAACTAAIATAAAAVAAADVADIAAVADHQPSAAPLVAAIGAAVAVNVDAVSNADQRAPLAKLTLAIND